MARGGASPTVVPPPDDRRRREEPAMTTLKTARAYARYALSALAAVAFGSTLQ